MIYLKHGMSIPKIDWEDALEKKSLGTFIIALLDALYTPEVLAVRCVVEGPTVLTPEKKNRRTAFTPKEIDTFKSNLF